MTVIDTIRTRYPAPIMCPDDNRDLTGCYCVGGALALYHQDGSLLAERFPTSGALSIILYNMNSGLDADTALKFATVITTLNDADHMDVAWMAAELALTFVKETACP